MWLAFADSWLNLELVVAWTGGGLSDWVQFCWTLVGFKCWQQIVKDEVLDRQHVGAWMALFVLLVQLTAGIAAEWQDVSGSVGLLLLLLFQSLVTSCGVFWWGSAWTGSDGTLPEHEGEKEEVVGLLLDNRERRRDEVWLGWLDVWGKRQILDSLLIVLIFSCKLDGWGCRRGRFWILN